MGAAQCRVPGDCVHAPVAGVCARACFPWGRGPRHVRHRYGRIDPQGRAMRTPPLIAATSGRAQPTRSPRCRCIAGELRSSRALSIRHSDIFRRSGGTAPRGSCGAASSAGSRHMTRALGRRRPRTYVGVGPPEASRPGGSESSSVRLEVDVRDSGWPSMSVSASGSMPAAIPAGNACTAGTACVPFHR